MKKNFGFFKSLHIFAFEKLFQGKNEHFYTLKRSLFAMAASSCVGLDDDGLDLSSIYREITFAPAVADWETTIYENNDDF